MRYSKTLQQRASDLVDSALLAVFRIRTRGFLKMENAPGEVPAVPKTGTTSLYLHVPFCESLCPFCSFHRVQHDRALAKTYFRNLREEVRRYHAAGFKFGSAYFGGGTPTCDPAELVKTVELVGDLFGVREISVETNPRHLRNEILEPLREAGVTRLSVGVQSFDDDLLRQMDRFEKYGSGHEAAEHIQRAASMFPTLNVDLIFNQPQQTEASLEYDLQMFRSTGANQVSLYPLMMSPSIRNRMIESTGLPNRQHLHELYRLIVNRLTPEFEATSAWCFTRRGNAGDEYIVDADNYVGVGSGAFSYLDGVLYATTFCLKTYEQLVEEGLTGITVRSRLSRANQIRYALLVKMFGLRLERSWAIKRFGQSFFRTVWGELRTLEWLGAAKRDEDGWQLTDRGMYWLVLMMSAFFESVAKYREAMRAHIPEEKVASHPSTVNRRPVVFADNTIVFRDTCQTDPARLSSSRVE